MINFFVGLDDAVGADIEDCGKAADAINAYYESRREWIENLSYATVSADADAIEQIRKLAESFGKKLSVCYYEPRIAELLQKYARLP